jgi:hypothetical protein
LPGSAVRSIRSAVMKRVLLPAGFVKGRGGTYVRRSGDQIHLIDFQASRYEHQYTVNLAFHYTFLRPLFARRTIKLADYSQFDCGLRARICDFTKSKLDQWFDYGTDRARLQQNFEQNARDCLKVFQTAANRFRDSSRLLTKHAGLNARLVHPWQGFDKEFFELLARHVYSKS